MIQLYTGVPGSGKTYKMVSDLAAWIKSQGDEPVRLLTNIKGLKLPHMDFEQFLDQSFPDFAGTFTQKLEAFFDYDNQAKLTETLEGPIFYVLDECQLYFPRRASMPKTEEYLQRHRHLGAHIYLASQSSKLINSRIVPLVEVEFFAVRRSISFFGEMRYRVKSPQSAELIKVITVRPDKRIFALYKSFEADELKRPERVLLKRLLPVLVFCLLMGIVVYKRYSSRLNPSPSPSSSEAVIDQKTALAIANANKAKSEAQEQSRKLESRLAVVEEKLAERERVVLDVVKVGTKRLTVDPDTLAVVPIEKIKHAVSCLGEDAIRCYYDRAPIEAITFAGAQSSAPSSDYSPGHPSFSAYNGGRGISDIVGISVNPPAPRTRSRGGGSGAFITPEMFDEPWQ